MKNNAFLITLISIGSLVSCAHQENIAKISVQLPETLTGNAFSISRNLNWLSNELSINIRWPIITLSLENLTENKQATLDVYRFEPLADLIKTISVKEDVDLQGLDDKMAPVLSKATTIWDRYGEKLTITSARDGKHCKNSLHYSGLALDLRSRDLKQSVRSQVLKELKSALGDGYVVLLEKDHFHLEYDRYAGSNVLGHTINLQDKARALNKI